MHDLLHKGMSLYGFLTFLDLFIILPFGLVLFLPFPRATFLQLGIALFSGYNQVEFEKRWDERGDRIVQRPTLGCTG